MSDIRVLLPMICRYQRPGQAHPAHSGTCGGRKIKASIPCATQQAASSRHGGSMQCKLLRMPCASAELAAAMWSPGRAL